MTGPRRQPDAAKGATAGADVEGIAEKRDLAGVEVEHREPGADTELARLSDRARVEQHRGVGRERRRASVPAATGPAARTPRAVGVPEHEDLGAGPRLDPFELGRGLRSVVVYS